VEAVEDIGFLISKKKTKRRKEKEKKKKRENSKRFLTGKRNSQGSSALEKEAGLGPLLLVQERGAGGVLKHILHTLPSLCRALQVHVGTDLVRHFLALKGESK